MCMCVCMCAVSAGALGGQKRVLALLELEICQLRVVRCWCWKPSPDPLGKQKAFLITNPSLHAP